MLEQNSDQKLRRAGECLFPFSHICAITDVGKVRSNNEDAMYVSQDGCILMVADGIGGEAAGELASSLSIEGAREALEALSPEQAADHSDQVGRLVGAMAAAQERVMQAAASNEAWRNMGSTLIAASVVGDEVCVAHVGDVRGYLYSSGVLERLTSDHSFVGELIRSQQISEEEARVHPKKGVIFQAIGMPRRIDPDIAIRALASGDRLLFCSDGLWGSLPETEIRDILASDGSVRQLTTVLVDRANANGGDDNITLIVYEHPVTTRKESDDQPSVGSL